MTEKAPKVSIGLPVYNGEDFLHEAIESILNQTFTDFELIITDNASTDSTAEICQQYAASDARIRYHRNQENIGVANNHNLNFELAHGEYYRWAAHDDVNSPELIEKCVAVLDNDPSVVLCYTQTVSIDASGSKMNVVSLKRATSNRAYQRFNDLAFRNDYCEPTYGLIRADVLRNTRLERNYTGSDRVMLCEIGFQGKFHEIPEPLFQKRHHAKNEYKDWRARMAWYNPGTEGDIVFPNWQQFLDYFVAIWRADIPLWDKALCHVTMGKWLLVHGKSMVKDVLVAANMLIRSRESRKNAGVYNWE
ncbi:MAG: glycosyltransferase [Caldilineaceae bacterium]